MTERCGRGLLTFILGSIPQSEVVDFVDDLVKVVEGSQSTRTRQEITIVLRDWQATAEIYANPELAQEIDAARRESEQSSLEEPV